MKKIIILAIFLVSIVFSSVKSNDRASKNEIPELYQNLKYDGNNLYFTNPATNEIYSLKKYIEGLTISNITNPGIGTANGLSFDFKFKKLNGKLYYGLYQENNSRYKYPIYHNKFSEIKNGKSEINILKELSDKRDIANWQNDGLAKIGYRIVDEHGDFLYDGKIVFAGKGPFTVVPHIIEGPFVNCITDSSVIITFTTNTVYCPIITIDNKQYQGNPNSNSHEVEIMNLKPDTDYDYKIVMQNYEETQKFKTNPIKGSRNPFKFAFSSDSRSGYGGGERDLNGSNAYIMKKSAALAIQQGARFFQFTGDMINGYLPSYNETLLQYSNWKRSIEPFAGLLPFYPGMGNHENIGFVFEDESTYGLTIDKFPFSTFSSESAFITKFTNFRNGPLSEDNSKYDINPSKIDFPSYDEQVYYYTYGNTAMIVLNSNYLYIPSKNAIKLIGGNLHGYIMDNQLKWLGEIVDKLDKDKDIDHIFVTVHTPAFPNGGHANDAMWYFGNNEYRPYLFGKRVEKGIIERRDDFLDILSNKSHKVVALLTGDEHNYSRMLVSNNTIRYPDTWFMKKMELRNPFWQIVNGAAGAPYYGQEKLPWSDDVKYFTSEHALCIFEVNGATITLEVINPETLETLEKLILK